MKLSVSKALVTGGAHRIGRAICLALASRGCGVAVHYNTSRSRAEKTVAMVKELGAESCLVQGDLSSADETRAIFDAALNRMGGLDVLVNNASIFRKDKTDEFDLDEFVDEMRVNFLGPVMLSHLFAVGTKHDASSPAKIVNLLDRRIAGFGNDSLPYTISKKMLAEFTRSAAVKYAPSVAVNAVAPGAVLPPTGSDEKLAREAAGRALLETPLDPNDIASAVVFLVECDAITGQVVFVDGGQNLILR